MSGPFDKLRANECLPLCYDRTRDRMGARVMASGMPGGIPPRGARRRTYSVFQGASPSSRGRTPAAASQQRHIPWRASSSRHVRSA